ncbi:MAG TPA: hemolysin family protein [Smithellaceae bacterium]|nr:hemolysin family protein [Smithellaceae bacterium]
MDLTFQITIILILLLLSGFFSSSEAALFSLTELHRHKMKMDRYPFLRLVSELLAKPRRLLITIVVGNDAVNIGLSVVAASLFIGLLGMNGEWVAIAFTSSLVLITGEAVPKTFGVTYPMPISSAVSPLLAIFSRLVYPIVISLEKVSDFILRRYVHGSSRSAADPVMEEEFKTLIDVGSREGVVEEAQKELINRIFALGDKPVTDIMVPRVDMFCLPAHLPMTEVIAAVVRERHERVPVYEGDRDDIIGIIYARDLLHAALQETEIRSIAALLKRPYFVPEDKTINGLLHDFRENRMQIAIVVDEYGGVSGLVSLEDIMEHLFEEEIADCVHLQDGCELIDEKTMVVPGKMSMEQFNALIHGDITQPEFDTVGGFVLHLFGKLPARGESVSSDGYRFIVESVGKARILKIRVEKTVTEAEEQ